MGQLAAKQCMGTELADSPRRTRLKAVHAK